MKTSDLTLSILVIFIFILLYIFNLLVVGIQRIKANWPVYRCQPLIMPFASVFGHDSSENFAYCIANMQKNFMGPLLQPLNFNISSLGDITGGLTNNLNINRDFINPSRKFGVMFELRKRQMDVHKHILRYFFCVFYILYILQDLLCGRSRFIFKNYEIMNNKII